MDNFLGHPTSYWFELQRRVNDLGVDDLLRDLATLSAKVNYYETMLKRMNDFKTAAEK